MTNTYWIDKHRGSPELRELHSIKIGGNHMKLLAEHKFLAVFSCAVGVGFPFLIHMARPDYRESTAAYPVFLVFIGIIMACGVFISGILGSAISDAQRARDECKNTLLQLSLRIITKINSRR